MFKLFQILLLFQISSLHSEPFRFQREQISYSYHAKTFNEATVEKFHNLFLQYHLKTFEELEAKKKLPLRVEIYTSPEEFRKETGLASFTAGFFEREREVFYFLLTPKTLQEEKLITLISHEFCHAALHSRKNDSNQIVPSLEEGFCFLEYPPEILNTRKIESYCEKNFSEFIILSEKNLRSNDKRKRESAYALSSRFMKFIKTRVNKENLIQILLAKDNRKELEIYWNLYRKKCK